MKKLPLILCILFYSTNAFSLDCTRPIKNLWSGYDPNRIYVIHGDGYSNSGMKLEYVNNDEAVLNRTLSIIMSASMSNKTITFRYTGGVDGSVPSCTPTVQQKLIGAWINF